MKKIIILAIIVVLMIINYSVGRKYFKGYGGIETWQWGNKLTVKTDSSEWTVILPKKLSLEQEFALEIWKNILNVRFPENDNTARIMAKEKIQLLVEVLAAKIKTGKKSFKDVSIGFKDVEKALNILWETSFIAADGFVGNLNGYCSSQEIYKLKMSPQSRIVGEMTKTYSSF